MVAAAIGGPGVTVDGQVVSVQIIAIAALVSVCQRTWPIGDFAIIAFYDQITSHYNMPVVVMG